MSEQDPAAAFDVFKLEPPHLDEGKTWGSLTRGEGFSLGYQVVASGGENNLHAHTGTDEIWLVVRGEMTVYTEGDRVVGKLGPESGVLIPRRTPYWFESTGDEPLVVLRFGMKVPGVKEERIDYTPPSETIKKLLETLPASER